jgi:hypothetical protein
MTTPALKAESDELVILDMMNQCACVLRMALHLLADLSCGPSGKVDIEYGSGDFPATACRGVVAALTGLKVRSLASDDLAIGSLNIPIHHLNFPTSVKVLIARRKEIDAAMAVRAAWVMDHRHERFEALDRLGLFGGRERAFFDSRLPRAAGWVRSLIRCLHNPLVLP